MVISYLFFKLLFHMDFLQTKCVDAGRDGV
jgi:hypothetical protein